MAQGSIDSLELAKKMRNEQKFSAAYTLLIAYHKNHPGELNALWLAAQTAYWQKHYKTAMSLYDEAINANPGNFYLKLDYANVLSVTGEYEKAISLLDAYLKYEPSNVEAQTILATIAYWQGNYNVAGGILNKMLVKHPDNENAKALLQDILAARAPWVKFGGSYITDEQPLQSVTPVAEASIFLDPVATLHTAIEVPYFIRDAGNSNALSFHLGNRSNFYKQGIVTDISVGAAHFPYRNSWAFIGNISVAKKIIKNLVITVAGSRRPYLYSLASLDTIIVENNLEASVCWNKQQTINGIAGISYSSFPDANTVFSFYANLLSPQFKAANFSVQAGYGYNFSNAQKNHFTPSVSTAQATALPDAFISGVYDPYFTARNQQSHSAIIIIAYKPVKSISMGASVNYGFYGTTDNPYFLAVKQGNTVTGFSKYYSTAVFHPAKADAYCSLQATKKISININYQYQHTIFYSNHYIGLSVKKSFWNEKK